MTGPRLPLTDMARRVARDIPSGSYVNLGIGMPEGVAAVAAYVLGPGLGSYIFTGLVSLGGANALNYALVGTLGIVVVALVLDGLLVLLGRLTISKGLRA